MPGVVGFYKKTPSGKFDSCNEEDCTSACEKVKFFSGEGNR